MEIGGRCSWSFIRRRCATPAPSGSSPRGAWRRARRPARPPRASSRKRPAWSSGSFREGFEKSLSYTYIRRGRKVVKTVTYYLVEVRDVQALSRSAEHVEDPYGHWHHWGSFEQISRLLYHAKIRQVFAEADAWLRGGP